MRSAVDVASDRGHSNPAMLGKGAAEFQQIVYADRFKLGHGGNLRFFAQKARFAVDTGFLW